MFLTSLQGFSTLFSSEPSVFVVQFSMVVGLGLIVFLILFATRDIILRTNSFLFQAACIIVVALLPVVGFLLYLLIRPSRTLAQRALEQQVAELAGRMLKGRGGGKERKGRKEGKEGVV